MNFSNEEEIRKEISRSRKSLKSAKILLEEGLFEDTISCSYYAILHATKAVLLSEGITVGSHDAVKS